MSPIRSVMARSLRARPLTQTKPRAFTAPERNVGMAASPQASTSHFPRQNAQSFYPQRTDLPIFAPNPSPSALESSPYTSRNPFTKLQDALGAHLATHPTTSLTPTLPALFSLLRNYTSDAGDWSAFAHANSNKHYTRNLVCEVPGLFNLLMLVWTPGKKSPVHDHADSHCLMKASTFFYYHILSSPCFFQPLQGKYIPIYRFHK